ncbi:sn-glycerol 3-phosphate transport system substrate-binding protein [Bradyrhizobium ottawaense]
MGRKVAFIAALFGALALVGPAQARVEVQWWHAMSGVLGDRLNELVEKFNKSQDKYTIVAVAKGNYDEVTNGVIAAYRAKRPPEMVQIAERGYMTMLLSGAIVPVQDLVEQKGYKIDFSDFIKPVASFWSYKGRMSAMPFNSSTPIFWYNKDHFQKAGFDKPADTWQELEKQLYTIKSKGISECGTVLPGDFYWSLLENYSAINNQPYGTLANGFDGLGTEFVYNKTKVVSQVARLKKWLDDGVMQIAGQGFSPEQLFTSGRCSTFVNSTASHGNIERNATINWSATFLPHESDINPPLNSTIGGWGHLGHEGPHAGAIRGRRSLSGFRRAAGNPGLVAWRNRLCSRHQSRLCGRAGAGLLQGSSDQGDRGAAALARHAERELPRLSLRQLRADDAGPAPGGRGGVRRSEAAAAGHG